MAELKRRHILEPYTINGHSVRYSVRLRNWVVDELHYFQDKKAAFRFAQTEEPDAHVLHEGRDG